MAKETRQDRFVRGISEQLTEHLHEFKGIEANPNTKESDVEVWCQSFIKTCLGFTPSAGYSVRSQESKGRMRPDLVIYKGENPILVVEVKKLGFDLDKSDFRSGKVQLAEYLGTMSGVKWGMLSNGTEWKLFDFSQKSKGGIQIAYFDLRGEAEQIELSRTAIEELAYSITDFHEATYSKGVWPDLAKEATAFSPDSIARAILSNDVMKMIGKSINGEHEFNANAEILTDRVFEVLEVGLNDAMTDWNEAKANELRKYIKSQKRAVRRQRRTARKPENAKEAALLVLPENAAPAAPQSPPSTAPEQVASVCVTATSQEDKKAA
jgi:hypothetical protein